MGCLLHAVFSSRVCMQCGIWPQTRAPSDSVSYVRSRSETIPGSLSEYIFTNLSTASYSGRHGRPSRVLCANHLFDRQEHYSALLGRDEEVGELREEGRVSRERRVSVPALAGGI